MLTHDPAQSVSPDAQLLTHPPPEQTSPLPHAWPQVPQFAWLVARDTHAPPQSEKPDGQPHLPPLQISPAGQA